MKKLLISLTVIAMVIIVLVACGEAEVEEQVSLIPEELIQISKDHNAGLEYIYNGLINSEDLSNSTEKVKKLTAEYYNTVYPEYEDAAIEYLNKGADRLEVYYDKLSLAKNTGKAVEDSYILYVIEEISDSLSDEQISLLMEINDISKSPSIDYIVSQVDDMINNKIPLLPEDERNLLYGTALMCRYSSEYWNENYDEWINLLSTDETLSKASFDWGAVADADVGTCITVLSGWATAAWLGATLPGLTFIVVTTGVASVVSSGVNAAQQIR